MRPADEWHARHAVFLFVVVLAAFLVGGWAGAAWCVGGALVLVLILLALGRAGYWR